MNTANLIRQLTAALNKNGSDFVFKRALLNIYKEPTGEVPVIATVKGIFYASSSYITIVINEAAKVPNKPTSQILATWDSAKAVQIDDTIDIGENAYKVTFVDNIQNLNFAGDISLEVVV